MEIHNIIIYLIQIILIKMVLHQLCKEVVVLIGTQSDGHYKIHIIIQYGIDLDP